MLSKHISRSNWTRLWDTGITAHKVGNWKYAKKKKIRCSKFSLDQKCKIKLQQN